MIDSTVFNYLINHPSLLIITITLFIIFIVLSQWKSKKTESEETGLSSSYVRTDTSYEYISNNVVETDTTTQNPVIYDIFEDPEINEENEGCISCINTLNKEDNRQEDTSDGSETDELGIDDRVVFAEIEVIEGQEEDMELTYDVITELKNHGIDEFSKVEYENVELRSNVEDSRNVRRENVASGAYESMEDLDDIHIV